MAVRVLNPRLCRREATRWDSGSSLKSTTKALVLGGNVVTGTSEKLKGEGDERECTGESRRRDLGGHGTAGELLAGRLQCRLGGLVDKFVDISVDGLAVGVDIRCSLMGDFVVGFRK